MSSVSDERAVIVTEYSSSASRTDSDDWYYVLSVGFNIGSAHRNNAANS